MLGVNQPRYAEYACSDCGYTFSGRIPPLCLDLPLCPLCSGQSKIVAPLAPHHGHGWAAQIVVGLVMLGSAHHSRFQNHHPVAHHQRRLNTPRLRRMDTRRE